MLVTLKEMNVLIKLDKADMNVPVTLSIARLVAATGL
jgi:hypothetical protein